MSKVNISLIFQAHQGGETVAIKNLIAKFPQSFEVDKIVINNHLVFSPRPKLKLLKYYLPLFSKCFDILRNLDKKEPPAIIITPIIPLLALTLLFPRLRQSKKVLTFHGTKHAGLSGELHYEKNMFRKIFYILPIYLTLDLIEKISSSVVDLIIIPGHSATKRLPPTFKGIDREKIKVVENGVGQDFFPKKYRIPKKPFRLCFIGRLAPEKGVLDLVTAFNKFLNQDYHLDLVYLPSPGNTYSKIVREKVVGNPSIRLYPGLPRKKIATFFRKCDLSILPSKDEIVSLSVTESISTGTPVICTRVGDLSKLIRKIEPRLLLSSSTPEAIANKISWYFSLPRSQQKKIYDKCLKASVAFSVTETANQLNHVIRSLLSK